MTIDSEAMSLLNSRTGRPEVAREDAEEAVRLADRYNGWTNRETWAAFTVLTNDYDLYQIALIAARQDDNGDALKDLSDVLEDHAFGDSIGQIALSIAKGYVKEVGSLWRVNWREIRDSLTEE